MSLYNKLGILTIALSLGWSCSVLKVNAQGLGNSPYTSVGIGELYNDSYTTNSGMGQSGVSMSNGYQINNLNPALWVKNKFTTLDFGVIGQVKSISRQQNEQVNAGGNLAYIALSFPVAPKWNIGVSMKPYSFVDYSNISSRNVSGTPYDASYIISGSGGINKASLTNAVQIGKYLSLGVEASYFFGNTRKASEATLPSNVGGDYLVSLSERTVYNDFSFRGGAAVRIPLQKDNKLNLNLGGAYSIGSDISARRTSSLDLTLNTFPVTAPDTIVKDKRGNITLPTQYQVGFSLEWPYKLTLSADYSNQSWSKYKSFEGRNDGMKDAGKIHLGVEYIPNAKSLAYFNNVRYRAGFSHGKLPYLINGRELDDTNVSLGFSLPMGREMLNSISIAFVGGQRGVDGPGVVRERYGKVVFGITLFERWFIKQKID